MVYPSSTQHESTPWGKDVEIVRTYGGPELVFGGRGLSSVGDVSFGEDDDYIAIWRKHTVDLAKLSL